MNDRQQMMEAIYMANDLRQGAQNEQQAEDVEDFLRSIDSFRDEFPQLVNDQVAMREALRMDQELIEAGDTRSYRDRFMAIGRELTGATVNDGMDQIAEQLLRGEPEHALAAVRFLRKGNFAPDDAESDLQSPEETSAVIEVLGSMRAGARVRTAIWQRAIDDMSIKTTPNDQEE